MTASAALDRALEPLLAGRRADDLYRHRRLLEGRQGAAIRLGDRTLDNFCSNDYLGLAGDPVVAEALRRGAERYGTGAGAAHLVTGHSRPHQALEEALAAFTGRPRALLFSTGYMANLGVIAALAGRGDGVFEDRLNHASLIDGALLSGARLVRYRHADADALEERLAGRPGGGRALVVTDGVFSMDGDIAPLPQLAVVAERYCATLVVDDAHGLGVLGREGRGTLEQTVTDDESVPVLVGTLGKAFGTFGAFVAGSETLIEALIQLARPYIYTTALPPAVAAASVTAVDKVREESWRRERLAALIRRFRAGAGQLGLPLTASTTPIQPLLVGSARRALAASRGLEERGFLVAAIRPPTVPEGTARLRITLSAAHDEAQIDRLLDALGAIRELFGDG